MPYITQADLEERFGAAELVRLTDRGDPSTGEADPDVVARAITDAEAEINGYLASRYTLPLTVVPEIVKRLAGDIARYLLYDDVVPDPVRDRYKDSVELLKGLASGKVSLNLPAADLPATQEETDKPVARTADRTFSREKLEEY